MYKARLLRLNVRKYGRHETTVEGPGLRIVLRPRQLASVSDIFSVLQEIAPLSTMNTDEIATNCRFLEPPLVVDTLVLTRTHTANVEIIVLMFVTMQRCDSKQEAPNARSRSCDSKSRPVPCLTRSCGRSFTKA